MADSVASPGAEGTWCRVVSPVGDFDQTEVWRPDAWLSGFGGEVHRIANHRSPLTRIAMARINDLNKRRRPTD